MTILDPCVDIPPLRSKFFCTLVPAKPDSLRLEMYSLGVFGKMPSRGFILKVSNKKVIHEPLKMAFLCPCVQILPYRLKPFFTLDPAKTGQFKT